MPPNFDWRMPVHVRFGAGCSDGLAAALGQRGALVTGMGEWGELTSASLAEAVRAAALRYLLAKVEREGGTGASIDDGTPPLELGLCSLLLGFSSTANIGVADSVYAIVRGVLEANRRFASGQQRRKAAIVRLEIVERSIESRPSQWRRSERILESPRRSAMGCPYWTYRTAVSRQPPVSSASGLRKKR